MSSLRVKSPENCTRKGCVVQHIPSMTCRSEQKKMAKFASGNNSIREGKMRANYEELQMVHAIMGDWAIKYQAKSEY